MNNVILYNVPWTAQGADVFHFKNYQEQAAYFNSLQPQQAFTNTRYTMEKSGTLVIPGATNRMQMYNYMSFYNEDPNGDGRTYYAYVNNIRRAGDGQCGVEYALDYWQTYQFEIKLMPSFVERRHVTRWDSRGQPIFDYCATPEDIEVGDVYTNGFLHGFENAYGYDNGGDLYFVWIVMTQKLEGSEVKVNDNVTGFGGYDKQYVYTTLFGVHPDGKIVRFNLNYYDEDGVEHTERLSNISAYDLDPLLTGDKVYAVYITNLYPGGLSLKRVNDHEYTVNASNISSVWWAGVGYNRVFTIRADYYSTGASEKRFNYTFDQELKASCYPYAYDTITINRAAELQIHPQYLEGNVSSAKTIPIRFQYCLSVGDKMKQGVQPLMYLGGFQNNMVVDDSVTELPLYSNAYINFMYSSKASMQAGLTNAQNSAITSTIGQVGTGVVSAAGAAAMNSPTGVLSSIAGTAAGVANTVQGWKNTERSYNAKITDLHNTPDSMRKGGNSAIFEMVNVSLGVRRFHSQIPDAQMARLKNYFMRFGYTCKTIMTNIPLQLRKSYDYIETRDCWIGGPVSTTVRNAIEGMFNAGVRLWHYKPGMQLGDYTLNNDEV